MIDWIVPALIILPAAGVIQRFFYRSDRQQKYIRDEKGRIMILHGINVSEEAKISDTYLANDSREDFRELNSRWGFNAVRLLVFWEGVEPARGLIDSSYLKMLRERLDWAHETGMKVILDMHQDLYARQFGGDGAPDWAIDSEGQAFESKTPWELNYLQPAVKTSIKNFWQSGDNPDGLQKHFIDSTLAVLDALADHPAVIGIDLYNEPLMSGFRGMWHFESKYLHSLLQNLINRIRSCYPDLWLFFEPSALGPNQGFKSKLKKLEDPRQGEVRLVYFPHLYPPDIDIFGRYLGSAFVSFWAWARNCEKRRYNSPMMVGEFGLSESTPGCLSYVNDACEVFDRIASGWFYWCNAKHGWGLVREDGSEYPKAKHLDRPYPRYIAGENPVYSYDFRRKRFSLEYEATEKFCGREDAPTVIYLPKRISEGRWSFDCSQRKAELNFNYETCVLKIVPGSAGTLKITAAAIEKVES